MTPAKAFATPEPIAQLLSQSEQRFRLFVSAVKDYAMFMLDADGKIISWNQGAERAKGYREEEVVGKHISIFYTPEDLATNKPQKLLNEAEREGRVEDEGWRVRKGGARFWADVVITAIRDEQGRLLGYAKVTRDLTERKQGEERLMAKQSEINKLQKMESLGRLTGGIAHDFNNLVAGILGCAESLEDALSDPKLRGEAVEIKKACERASALVRQLMAFSRRQMAAPKPVQINSIIENIAQLIRRSLPANIELVLNLDSELPVILADIGQIEQILLNLTLNARDAMPQGGQINIRTSTAWIDELSALDGFPERPAKAVVISVSDSGMGMSEDTKEKIFEPFFTTKELGKGSGLGLSTVYGIVQQNKGGLTVFSTPGLGTTMKIFLPQPLKDVSQTPTPHSDASEEKLTGGNELILVVEDEPLVLRNTVRLLQSHGYSVLSATHADEGLALFRKTKGKLRLVLSDVVMPGQSGKELAKIIRQEDSSIGIIFMSGYAPEIIATHGILTSETDFLEKPFSSAALLQKIRNTLDRSKYS